MTPPVITICPDYVTKSIPLGSASGGVKVDWTQPEATDDYTLVPLSRSSHTSGEKFPIGNTTISYVFTDTSGNQAFCNFTVTVEEVGKYNREYNSDTAIKHVVIHSSLSWITTISLTNQEILSFWFLPLWDLIFWYFLFVCTLMYLCFENWFSWFFLYDIADINSRKTLASAAVHLSFQSCLELKHFVIVISSQISLGLRATVILALWRNPCMVS